MRDDVKQELVAFLWAREIPIDQIAATTRRLFRQQYSSYDMPSKQGHRSLDAALFDDGTTTLGDTVTAGLSQGDLGCFEHQISP